MKKRYVFSHFYEGFMNFGSMFVSSQTVPADRPVASPSSVPPLVIEQPTIATISFNKRGGGLGLSIVAARVSVVYLLPNLCCEVGLAGTNT